MSSTALAAGAELLAVLLGSLLLDVWVPAAGVASMLSQFCSREPDNIDAVDVLAAVSDWVVPDVLTVLTAADPVACDSPALSENAG